jgi:hypothetical protein
MNAVPLAAVFKEEFTTSDIYNYNSISFAARLYL